MGPSFKLRRGGVHYGKFRRHFGGRHDHPRLDLGGGGSLALRSDLSAHERIVANAGNDLVEPDSGNDVALPGPGHDRFVWNPGEGDDVVDGETRTDSLEFNGSAGIESMTVTTPRNGGFRFFRRVSCLSVS